MHKGLRSVREGVAANGSPSNRRSQWLLKAIGVATLLLIGKSAGADPHPWRILAFGDSLTAGFGVREEDSFPVRLQQRLQADGIAVEIVNAGVSGDTTSGGLARLGWSLTQKPDLVLVELGANDALRGIDPGVARANLDRILARLREMGLPALLLGMKAPANWGRDYQLEFDAIFPNLAEKYAVPLYPFFLEGVAGDKELNQPDGLHPNARGVAVIVGRVAPEIEKLLRP